MQTYENEFQEFHKNNPAVYVSLVKLARQAVAAGARQTSIKLLFNVLRWNQMIDKTYDPNSSFKLNDKFHSRYGRLIMDQEPDLVGLFELRALRTQ